MSGAELRYFVRGNDGRELAANWGASGLIGGRVKDHAEDEGHRERWLVRFNAVWESHCS